MASVESILSGRRIKPEDQSLRTIDVDLIEATIRGELARARSSISRIRSRPELINMDLRQEEEKTPENLAHATVCRLGAEESVFEPFDLESLLARDDISSHEKEDIIQSLHNTPDTALNNPMVQDQATALPIYETAETKNDFQIDMGVGENSDTARMSIFDQLIREPGNRRNPQARNGRHSSSHLSFIARRDDGSLMRATDIVQYDPATARRIFDLTGRDPSALGFSEDRELRLDDIAGSFDEDPLVHPHRFQVTRSQDKLPNGKPLAVECYTPNGNLLRSKGVIVRSAGGLTGSLPKIELLGEIVDELRARDFSTYPSPEELLREASTATLQEVDHKEWQGSEFGGGFSSISTRMIPLPSSFSIFQQIEIHGFSQFPKSLVVVDRDLAQGLVLAAFLIALDPSKYLDYFHYNTPEYLGMALFLKDGSKEEVGIFPPANFFDIAALKPNTGLSLSDYMREQGTFVSTPTRLQLTADTPTSLTLASPSAKILFTTIKAVGTKLIISKTNDGKDLHFTIEIIGLKDNKQIDFVFRMKHLDDWVRNQPGIMGRRLLP